MHRYAEGTLGNVEKPLECRHLCRCRSNIAQKGTWPLQSTNQLRQALFFVRENYASFGVSFGVVRSRLVEMEGRGPGSYKKPTRALTEKGNSSTFIRDSTSFSTFRGFRRHSDA